MSRFYRELHDRELLMQAESSLRELQRRSLIDVILPEGDRSAFESAQTVVFPRRVEAVRHENGRLIVNVEKSFF